jgi:hypothetical protein
VARQHRARGAKTALGMDAGEAANRVALVWFRFVAQHRFVAYPLVIAASAAVFVFLWRMASLSVAIVVVGLCFVYGLALGIVASIRLRRLRGKI